MGVVWSAHVKVGRKHTSDVRLRPISACALQTRIYPPPHAHNHTYIRVQIKACVRTQVRSHTPMCKRTHTPSNNTRPRTYKKSNSHRKRQRKKRKYTTLTCTVLVVASLSASPSPPKRVLQKKRGLSWQRDPYL